MSNSLIDGAPKPTKYILGRWMVAPCGTTWGLAQCKKKMFRHYWCFKYYNLASKEAAINIYNHITTPGEILYP